jgi:hypothetical protein
MPEASDVPAPDSEREILMARVEMASGQAAHAVWRLRELVANGGFNPVNNYWLAAALGAAGDWTGHREMLNQAQTWHALKVIQAAGGDLVRLQHESEYATEIGRLFDEQGHVATASVCFGRGALSPEAPLTTTLSYAMALQNQGRIDEAVAAFAWVHESNPGWIAAHSFFLNSLSFAEDGVRRHADAARSWRRLYGESHRGAIAPFENAALRGRRLKIGYVVPRVDGQTKPFLMPVLDNHDPDRTHVTLYVKSHDEQTPIRADALKVIGDLDDAGAAELIRSDEIDVLVDLRGHDADGRLGVFVRKPAPVQVAWLASVQTTGVHEIDYLIHADCMKTADAQEQCVETIWSLGPTIFPFRPDPRPEPTPTPAKANGYVTFGSYNHPAQLSDQTFDAWARVLCRVPTSKLVLRHRFFVDEVLQNATLMRLAARGVEPDRILFRGAVDHPDYYDSFAEIDIALDPSPHPGVTSTLDALANGAPVLTLAGEDHVSRIGVAAVGPLGLAELIASSWDQYVERAIGLASDVEALDALRARVRTAFDRSGHRDEEGFTRRLEAAFMEMFDRWRTSNEPAVKIIVEAGAR